MSDDIFPLTMNIFDRFVSIYSSLTNDHDCLLIALCCYNLAKKLRTNVSINNENERISFISRNENYNDEEIFVSYFSKQYNKKEKKSKIEKLILEYRTTYSSNIRLGYINYSST